MTKLFYENIYLTTFDATVTACTYNEQTSKYEVILDRTAFFPEEGGQSADKGTLDGLTVQDVQIHNDIIYHLMDAPFTVGSTVTGQVDWAQRFDFMQQHSGEHIVSGLVHARYGYDNVGFHLGLQDVTLDFNGVLTLEQLREIENEANAAVWRNLPVNITYPSPDELQTLPYRSKLDLTENVRIVTIPGIDTCACCAPHVESTGQIGLIKITGVQNHRGGVRVNILCGGRAVSDYTEKQNSISDISVRLSAKQSAVADAVARLQDENLHLKHFNNMLQVKLFDSAIKGLPTPEQSSHAICFVELMNDVAVRNAINELVMKYSGYVAVFAGNDTDGYRFIIGSANQDCRHLANHMRQTLHAKGGGSAPMIQGTVHATEKEIRQLLSTL